MAEATAATATRINISIAEEGLEDLRKMAMESGMNISEFVRNSVRVYGALKNELKNPDTRIYIGTNDKVSKEIILP